jgi:hypothetical protein
MRKPIAIAAASATLLAGGTAIAATGNHPLERVFGDRDAELADELAQRLDGVSADEIESALEDIRDDKQAERRKQQAAALAKHLDGVSAEEAEKALERVEARLFAERPRDRRDFPRRGFHRVDLVAELAKELGKSEREVRKAFRAAHRERFDATLDEAVKEGRLTEKQADAMRDRAEELRKRFEDGRPKVGPPPHRFHRGGPGPGFDLGPEPGAPPPQIQ